MKQTYNVGYLQTPSVKHLANVKQALADTGLASPTTPNEMLPTAIEEGLAELKPENVRSGVKIGQVEGSLAIELKDINVNNYLKTKGKTIFYASNGIDAYYSYNGIVYVNLITKEEQQIYDNQDGNIWLYYFEATNGDIYVGSSSSTRSGIIRIRNHIATKIYSAANINFLVFYEINETDVYCTTNSNSAGLVYLNGDNGKKVASGVYMRTYIENNDGSFYVISDTSNSGVYLIREDNVTQLSSTGYGKKFIKMNDNNVLLVGYPTQLISSTFIEKIGESSTYYIENKNTMYVGTSSGILTINKTTAEFKIIGSTELNTSFINAIFFIDSNNNVYIGDTYAAFLVHVKDDIVTILDNVKGNYSFYESKNGDVYAVSKTSQNKKALLLKGNESIVISTEFYGDSIFVEDNDNNVYVSFTNQNGIWYLNGEEQPVNLSKDLPNSGSFGQTYIDKKGNLYGFAVSQNNTYAYGILHITPSKITRLPFANSTNSSDRYWHCIEVEEGVIFSQSNSMFENTNLLLVDGTDFHYLIKE